MKGLVKLLALVAAVSLSACGGNVVSPLPHPTPVPPVTKTTPPTEAFTIVGRYPHDPTLFTQGLELTSDGLLVESAGLYGQSKLLLRSLEDPTPVKVQSLDEKIFAEGVTVLPDGYLQVTWKNHVAFKYDKNLKKVAEYPLAGEGWGVCYDKAADVVYRSDGLGVLHSHSPKDFRLLSTISLVDEAGSPLFNLNELECTSDGFVWGNVWMTNKLVKIDLKTGKVARTYDMDSLRAEVAEKAGGRLSQEQVLNGITYDEDQDIWLLTGKQWPTLFSVRLK